MNVRYLKFSRKLGAISGETCNLAQNSKGSQTISETIHISDNFTQRFDVFTIFLVRNIRNVSACLKNNHKNFNIECAVLVFFPFLFCFCFLLQLFCCCCLCLISEPASMPVSGFVPEFAVTFFKID